jgi:hypothetical protein
MIEVPHIDAVGTGDLVTAPGSGREINTFFSYLGQDYDRKKEWKRQGPEKRSARIKEPSQFSQVTLCHDIYF